MTGARTLTRSDIDAVADRVVKALRKAGAPDLPEPKLQPLENMVALPDVPPSANRLVIAANNSGVTAENANLQALPAPMVKALLCRPFGL